MSYRGIIEIYIELKEDLDNKTIKEIKEAVDELLEGLDFEYANNIISGGGLHNSLHGDKELEMEDFKEKYGKYIKNGVIEFVYCDVPTTTVIFGD